MKIETKDEAIHYFKIACIREHSNPSSNIKSSKNTQYNTNMWEVVYNKNLIRIAKGYPQSLIIEKGETEVQEGKLPKIIIFPPYEQGEPIKGIITFELSESEYNDLELYYFGEKGLKSLNPSTEQPIPQEYIDRLISKETKLRSLIKAVSWRIVGTIDTMVIAYILSGKLFLSLSIGGIEVFTKIILFYFHERFWNKIKIGKK